MPKHPYTALVGCGLTLVLGCAEGDDPKSSDELAMASGLRLEEPERGVQLATVGREIAPGEDEEWCEVVELPGDSDEVYFVARTEVEMTAYSHHLIVSVAPEGSESLVDLPLHEPMRCAGAHQLGADLTNLAGSGRAYTEAVMPEGIGFQLHGGQRVVFDYHAFNSSEEPIQSRHRLNLHFVDEIEKPARTFGFYNQYFEVPPGTERAFAEECHFKDDVLVWALTRHTHRLGKDFRVWWSGGERDGELIWTSRDWEQDIDYRFDEPIVVPAGVGFRWECELENPTEEPLVFGPQATDEMCILFGLFAAVGDDSEVGPQSCILFAP
jgi:hypothetical protein